MWSIHECEIYVFMTMKFIYEDYYYDVSSTLSFLCHILMEFNLQIAFSCINSSYILRLILI